MIIIHKVEGLLLGDAVHVGDLVPELHSVELVGVFQQLRPNKQMIYVKLLLERERKRRRRFYLKVVVMN